MGRSGEHYCYEHSDLLLEAVMEEEGQSFGFLGV